MSQLEKLYTDPNLYSTPDMFSPPAERRPHVIRFELTQGCSWGRCTYCCGFDGVPFREKTLEEYRDHVTRVFATLKEAKYFDLKRVFIGGGDFLAVDAEKLFKALDFTSWKFADHTRRSCARISAYGRTASIAAKSQHEYKILGGLLDLVYWGIESGSTDVLRYVNKGCTKKTILEAAGKLHDAGIGISAMLMPGLGGMRYYDRHVEETANVLWEIKPDFITFMGINAAPNSGYAQKMAREVEEGKNHPLTGVEKAQQMLDIIQLMGLPEKGAKVGCFSSEVDGVGDNPLTFGSRKVFPNGRLALANELRRDLYPTISWATSIFLGDATQLKYKCREILQDEGIDPERVTMTIDTKSAILSIEAPQDILGARSRFVQFIQHVQQRSRDEIHLTII